MYEIRVIQLSSETYFWAIRQAGRMIATSELIGEKSLVEAEAESISHQFGLGGVITIEERV